MKNSWKGFGHLLGAILVEFAGFEVALGILMGIIVLIFPFPAVLMDMSLGKGVKQRIFSWDVLFGKPWNVNILSLSRVWLFCSRDVWFEVAAPVFLKSVLDWPEFSVGLFMGGYIVVYGNLQTATTKIYKKKKAGQCEGEQSRYTRCGGLCVANGPPTEKHLPKWTWANAVQVFVWAVFCILRM